MTESQERPQLHSYGFKKGDDPAQADFESGYIQVVERRSKRWAQILSDGSGSVKLDDARVKRFIRKGIPPELRPQLWPMIAGAEEAIAKHPKEYARLCKIDPSQAAGHQIGLDLNRTFPENEHFQNLSSGVKDQLAQLLHCLAVKHPRVGYCQGLNYLAGMVLLVVNDPEKSFWTVESLMSEIIDYYTPGMKGLQVDIQVLRDLIRQRSKELDTFFTQMEFDLLLVLSKWFICWYIDVLPLETVMRVWDCLFHEGPKILFRVALTLLLKQKELILKARHFGEVVEAIQGLPKSAYALNCHHFIEDIFSVPGTLSSKNIEDLRKKFSAESKAK